MQTSMKNGVLSDTFQCKTEMAFFNLNNVFVDILWARKLSKIQKRLYYLQTNTIVTRRNVTGDFRIQFC